MPSLPRYKKILQSWKRFQFEIVSFVLAVLGAWLIWKLSHRPFVPDWVIYVILIWATILVLHNLRIIYLIRRSKKD